MSTALVPLGFLAIVLGTIAGGLAGARYAMRSSNVALDFLVRVLGVASGMLLGVCALGIQYGV